MKEGGMERKILNKNEYLRPDIKPIMTCIGSILDHKHSEQEDLKLDTLSVLLGKAKNSEFIDWEGSQKNLNEKGFKNMGNGSYVISTVDPKNKFSLGYANCTGLIVCGEDAESHSNISLLTHQRPDTFLHSEIGRKRFTSDLIEQLDQLKSKSSIKTIDARIVGGNVVSPKHTEDYLESVKLLREVVYEKFGFYPVVATGPKTTGGADHIVFFDTSNRRLFIGRHSMEHIPATLDFSAEELEKNEKNKWQFVKE